MTPQWWDDFEATYSENLNRMLVDLKLEQDPDPESHIRGFCFTIARVKSVSVGIDSKGFFAAVTVEDEDANLWTLYDDNDVHDGEDERVGRHSVDWSTIRERVAS